MLYNLLHDFNVGYEVNIAICVALCVIVPYLIGSLNFGIIFSKKMFKADVRESGSGNAGATNMLRTYGKKAGLITFLCDCLKTIVSMALAYLIMPVSKSDWIYLEIGIFIAGAFCMIGHTYPVFYKFKGGKGVACFAMVVLFSSIVMGVRCSGLFYIIFPVLFVCFAAIVIGSKFVSLGSVICSLLYPVLLNRLVDADSVVKGFHPYKTLEIFAIFIGLFVVFQHRENIKRLMNGEENKISLSKKKGNEEGKK